MKYTNKQVFMLNLQRHQGKQLCPPPHPLIYKSFLITVNWERLAWAGITSGWWGWSEHT